MEDVPVDLVRLAARDGGRAARLLRHVRDAMLAGERPPVSPRPEIGASWERMTRLAVRPDRQGEAVAVERAELEHRRRSTALGRAMPTVAEALTDLADTSSQMVAVTDEEGAVLWRSGDASVMRRAEGIRLVDGAVWAEHATGTNAIGTALAEGRPVRVHAAEHYVGALGEWTCAAAPVRDPRDGRLLGTIDVSGPARGFHPSALPLVTSVARLAESELRERHRQSVERLRSVAAPLLYRMRGRALVVDPHGWTAAVTGIAPVDRIVLPKSFGAGRTWHATLGMCTVEPLPGGWLVRVEGGEPDGRPAAGRAVLDVSGPGRPSLLVSGPAGSWRQELTPRHAELLYVLAVHRSGRSAAQLAADVFGDPTRAVTVRAEMSRVRRQLSGVLDHRPYRFREEVEVEVVAPANPADLLPLSQAPAVAGARRDCLAP
ncbi:helix-turn-helix domain-containing protein [Streptomyces fuscigenes]|uniref:helix-turn-helix domain-containing protein n=1 Tax=Streptomyces fuscigenes TaxID=1528880 RepID=UPI001F39C6E7|nr:helix-turn-helix domain-containing protein [Streptomyces fuscigenes]MCF3961308.1 GAF domain-containing protein [Streptomyces fuscigenes]